MTNTVLVEKQIQLGFDIFPQLRTEAVKDLFVDCFKGEEVYEFLLPQIEAAIFGFNLGEMIIETHFVHNGLVNIDGQNILIDSLSETVKEGDWCLTEQDFTVEHQDGIEDQSLIRLIMYI